MMTSMRMSWMRIMKMIMMRRALRLEYRYYIQIRIENRATQNI